MSPDRDHFVENGWQRALDAAREPVERAVRERYRDELAATTGWFAQWRLERRIRAEIHAELDRAAPPYALY